jgi:membrane protein CcdC involved in cytochrome C biogenesis
MAPSTSIRKTHRWLSAVFMLTVIANIISAAFSGPVWVGYVALPPLVVLLITGSYLFVLPYRSKRRAARQEST